MTRRLSENRKLEKLTTKYSAKNGRNGNTRYCDEKFIDCILGQAPSLEIDQLITATLAQAKRFHWKQSAAALLELYKEALASPKRKINT